LHFLTTQIAIGKEKGERNQHINTVKLTYN
jgi:hypothetical protein